MNKNYQYPYNPAKIWNTEEVKKKRKLIASDQLTKSRKIINTELYTWQPFPFLKLISDCQIWHDSAHKYATQAHLKSLKSQ